MTKDEALTLALDVLEHTQNEGYNLPSIAIREAITAIKAALAQMSTQCEVQPEQEPVAWMCCAFDGKVCEQSNHDECENPIPLYTTPPKRQPLTDDEINKCDMCGYVGKDKDSIGQCPKCRWDELRPLVEKARQKPLTDDQIYDMYNEPRSDAEMLEFARAIEAAHGIKEKNT